MSALTLLTWRRLLWLRARLAQRAYDVLLVLQRQAAVLPSPVRRAVRGRVPGLHAAVRQPEGWGRPLVTRTRSDATAPPEPVTAGRARSGLPSTPAPAAPTPAAPAVAATAINRGLLAPVSFLVVTGSLDVGGMDAFVDFLARGLRSRGATVSVMVASEQAAEVDGRVAAALRADGFPVVCAGPGSVGAQLQRLDVDGVSLHGAADWAVEAAAARGLPVVEVLHGMHTLDDPDRLAARARLLTRVVAVSDHVRRQYLARVLRLEPGRIVVVPNGVPSRRQPPEVRQAARSALGLTEELLFVSLGRYCLQKNTFGLVSAFDAVAAAVPDAHLLVAGRMDDAAYFAQVSARRDRSPHRARIHLRDHAEEPSALLAAADAFVLDSFFEGWSLASTEALTAGLPVVLADVGGAAEQIRWADPPGVVVANPLGDPEAVTWERMASARFREQTNAAALATAMIDIARRREQWSQRREAISREAELRFTPEACLDRHVAVLLEACGREHERQPITLTVPTARASGSGRAH